MRGNEESLWREDRPLNTLDGREVRELRQKEMKVEIEDEMIDEEREIRER